MKFSVHHLSFTLPRYTPPEQIPELLKGFFGLDNLVSDDLRQKKGRHGYKELYLVKGPHGAELISVATSPAKPDSRSSNCNTTNITVHGALLEQEVLDLTELAKNVYRQRGWATCLHLAFDDSDTKRKLPWKKIKQACIYDYKTAINTKFLFRKKNKLTGKFDSNGPRLLTSDSGETIYLGSQKGDNSIRIYNARGFVRFELVIGDKTLVNSLLTALAGGLSLAEYAAQLLRYYLDFLEPGTGRVDRRTVSPWWLRFTGAAEKATLPPVAPRNKSPWYVPPDPVKRLEKELTKRLAGPDAERVLSVMDSAATQYRAGKGFDFQ